MFANTGILSRRLIVGLAALGLLVAACGDSDDPVVTDDPVLTEETVPEDVGDSGGADATCLASDPDCRDNPATDDGSESDGLGSPGSSGMIVDGGLTVSEALETDATGVIAVQGHLFDDGSGMVLCESLVGGGEAYECDGARLPVEGLPLDEYEGALVHQGGTSYTDATVTLLGEIVDGVLVLDPLSA